MANISKPYEIQYPEITAVVSEDEKRVELIEKFDCIGGAMWAGHHYKKSPVVENIRIIGDTQRFILTPGQTDLPLEGSYFPAGISGVKVGENEVAISYRGLGGGGVGAGICRASATGVHHATSDPSGGGKEAGSTIWLPKRERVIIGIDDTDTPTEGATWTLAHNIARAVEDEKSRYLSHTIVQLFPVPYRTKNCVAIACEFATSDPEGLACRFEELIREYTLSDETGLAVFKGFDPSPLSEFGWRVKKGEVTMADLEAVKEHVLIRMNGRGIIGAVAAIPFYTRYHEALELWSGKD